uniref:Ras and EF-hand domain-containing protein n=1 Tax=Cacopsylla melanoneura TaxID=428564 RepID=A0A8D8LCR3_9HEMI
MSDLQLEELFKTCDKKGTGQIGPEEFRELCTGFDIQPADSDAIFADLDHDGDGKVSLEDFAYGFREYLNSNMRKQKNSSAASSEAMERRNSEVQNAWSLLLAGIGEANVNKFLNTSFVLSFSVAKSLQICTTNCARAQIVQKLSPILREHSALY